MHMQFNNYPLPRQVLGGLGNDATTPINIVDPTAPGGQNIPINTEPGGGWQNVPGTFPRRGGYNIVDPQAPGGQNGPMIPPNGGVLGGWGSRMGTGGNPGGRRMMPMQNGNLQALQRNFINALMQRRGQQNPAVPQQTSDDSTDTSFSSANKSQE
jgi:hypothetical protein